MRISPLGIFGANHDSVQVVVGSVKCNSRYAVRPRLPREDEQDEP